MLGTLGGALLDHVLNEAENHARSCPDEFSSIKFPLNCLFLLLPVAV
jgi:hypothetical protein